MKNFKINWAIVLVFNLCVVVFLGLVLRYKLAFNLAVFDFKNILHAHSHFAFAGWVSQSIYFLLIHCAHSEIKAKKKLGLYNALSVGNLLCSYCMLFSFCLQGYGSISIIFSTLTILISYIFTYHYGVDTKKSKGNLHYQRWFYVALFFNIFSSFGTFFLAYLGANKIVQPQWYVSSIYFYLHFQYNGWFLFALIGLILKQFQVQDSKVNILLWLFALTTIFNYFLSVLWLNLPLMVEILVCVSVILHAFVWYILYKMFIPYYNRANAFSKKMLYLIGLAFHLKIMMQFGLVLPKIAQIVYGTRTLVIAYLHLVLLGLVTLFLLYYFVQINLFRVNVWLKRGVFLFVLGIISNEVVLFTQGGLANLYIVFPYVNKLLLLISIFLFVGVLLILISQRTLKKAVVIKE